MRSPSTSDEVIMDQVAAVAFGSNIGNRQGNIVSALNVLSGFVRLMAVSGLYETAPMYEESQPMFLNGAALVSPTQNPVELLRILKMVENMVGRQAREKNGPREIDLDLVAFGQTRSKMGDLELPHPKAHERRFVLEPLNEIAPDLLLPGYGTVHQLLAQPVVQIQKVKRVSDAPVSVQSS